PPPRMPTLCQAASHCAKCVPKQQSRGIVQTVTFCDSSSALSRGPACSGWLGTEPLGSAALGKIRHRTTCLWPTAAPQLGHPPDMLEHVGPLAPLLFPCSKCRNSNDLHSESTWATV